MDSDNIQIFPRKNVFDTEQKMYKKLVQCPVLGLGGVIIACLAKSHANLLWEKKSYVNVDSLWTFTRRLKYVHIWILNIYILLG